MQKLVLTLCIALSTIGMYAQTNTANISTINKHLNLPDSLTQTNEIRVYQNQSNSNYSSVMRIYKRNDTIWKAEFYEHFAAIPGQTELRIQKRKLKSLDHPIAYVFFNLTRSYIMELPTQNAIEWKMKDRAVITENTAATNSTDYDEYVVTSKKSSIVDGVGYTIMAKHGNTYNVFSYNNPENYLKLYPEIDELVYVNELLTILKTEFDIWK